jgi:hypothetical protein
MTDPKLARHEILEFLERVARVPISTAEFQATFTRSEVQSMLAVIRAACLVLDDLTELGPERIGELHFRGGPIGDLNEGFEELVKKTLQMILLLGRIPGQSPSP